MRNRTLFGLVTFFALVVLLTYKHLLVLGEVAITYTGIHFKNIHHYDFPTDSNGVALLNETHDDTDSLAPKIIHQVYLNEGDTDANGAERTLVSHVSKNADARQSCFDAHPDWEFKLWTSNNATKFVREFYPEISKHYESYPQTIQRANILRYLLLHHYGGVYLDLDLYCRTSLNGLRHLTWITPGAHPVGINNAFILTRPRHPFLEKVLIPAMPRHDLKWGLPYVENMLSTGCMFFSSMFMLFSTADMKVLGGGTKHFLRGHAVTPLFEHMGESSWHQWDAAVFMFISKNLLLLVLGPTILVLAIVFTWGGRGRNAVHYLMQKASRNPRHGTKEQLLPTFSERSMSRNNAKLYQQH